MTDRLTGDILITVLVIVLICFVLTMAVVHGIKADIQVLDSSIDRLRITIEILQSIIRAK